MGVLLVAWKDVKELVTTLDFYIRLRVQATFNAPDTDEVIMMGAYTIIPHDSFTEEILFTISDDDCGVTVIGAPSGPGKSTYYDRTLPGGLQRLGRRRDLDDVGDAS